jgi:predicted PurR-regulated permease PerM
MNVTMRTDRAFFYLFLTLVTIGTFFLIRPYLGAVVLAITFAVVLRPLHDFYVHRFGGRQGVATALTLVTTILLVLIPALIGLYLLFSSFTALSSDVATVLHEREDLWLSQAEQIDAWLQSTGLEDQLQLGDRSVSETVRDWISASGRSLARWLAERSLSTFQLIVPMIVFVSMLGALLTNHERTVALLKRLSPLDDDIDQLFLDRMSIMTKAMMRSIVIIAILQGVVTGMMLAIGRTPHVIALTISAVLFSILPLGAAIVAVPVGLIHVLVGNTWQGALIILGTVTLVASLDNQIRPLLVSKDAYLNRALVLLSVFSGIALFGYMGVVYGPLIMILFLTTLDVYVTYYRTDLASAPVTSKADASADDSP